VRSYYAQTDRKHIVTVRKTYLPATLLMQAYSFGV